MDISQTEDYLAVLEAISSTRTGASWTMLDTVVNKMNKKHSWKQTPRDIDALLVSVGDENLKSLGIFRTSFGKNYMPIVLTNPTYAKAVKAGKQCSCGIAKDEASNKVSRTMDSTAYNAGRHNSNKSDHKINCPEWLPPGAGHLHSWRRGYLDDGKK